MKRFLVLAAAIFIALSSLVFSAGAESDIVIKLDGIDCPRGGNQTVLYSKSGTKTDTNEWGYEITVTEGRVTSVGGNNSLIPEGDNSFVVSAHGNAMTALTDVKVGMTAKYNKTSKTVTFSVDEGLYMSRIDLARNELLDLRNNAVEGCYVISENAEAEFEEIEKKYYELGGKADESDASSFVSEYSRLKTLYAERAVAEYRGIWVNPTQKNYAEVESLVRKCVRAGINMISLETLFDCTTICPMPETSYFEHNPYFEGFDVLDAYIKACHKYGIELHCWMHIYSVGDKASVNYSKSITAKNPEWRLKDSKGNYLDGFLNPANPEARNALLESYRYILGNYDIDAFQLDYIRYSTVTGELDYGYDEITVNRFKKAYPQYADREITYNRSADYWSDWVDFRNGCVSELVCEMRALIDEVSPDVLLSADVGSVLRATRDSNYQDPANWMKNGYLDIVHPMAYSEDEYDNVKAFFDYTEDKCIVVPALGAYIDGFDAEMMLSQAYGMTNLGCFGVAYFAEEGFFNKNCDVLLLDTIYTSDSLPPALNGANTAIAELTRFIERIELAYSRGYLTLDTKNALKAEAKTAMNLIKSERAYSSLDEINTLYKKIKELKESALRDRLCKDIENAISAIKRKPNDIYTEYSVMDNTLSNITSKTTQLTLDKINSPHTGEDSVIITDLSRIKDYNLNYAYVMLLRLECPEKRLYSLVEAKRNWGVFNGFDTEIEEGMIAISFHSNDIGSGAERRNLAETVEIGTMLALWGVDADKGEYTNLNSLVYVTNAIPNSRLDINGDGKFNTFDCFAIKMAYFNPDACTEEILLRSDLFEDGQINMFDYYAIKREYFRKD